jgi:hypothetical protein
LTVGERKSREDQGGGDSCCNRKRLHVM